jgi:pimeloyl-ACP methyl ester carboxylesterase
MTYEQYRFAEITAFYEGQLDQFLNGFDVRRPTVLLLPGGMGSQLERTAYPYPRNPNAINDTIWVDLGIIFNQDALKLEIETRVRDKDSYVVAADHAFKFMFTKPYEQLEDLARREGWNYCEFGFDWRRSLSESGNFLKTFVANFRDRVRKTFKKDPIPNLTIVCHSMGGMVCTTALRDQRFCSLPFNAVATVATPFYGTSTQQERYFNGENILNPLYGPKTVVAIISSLPGPYTLLFLPREIYNRDGQKLGLVRYPEYDPNGNIAVDPFDPGLIKRWPKVVRDHRQFLIQAKAEMIDVAEPIHPEIAPVFFNVRSSLDATTAIELLWSDINGDDIIPGSGQSPLVGIPGPGDGTVPAWSAWHAHSRLGNRHELKQASDHGRLLEHPEVLSVIDSIVKTRKLPTVSKRRAGRPPAVASPSKVDRVMNQAAKRRDRKQGPPPELFEKSVQRAIITKLISGDKPTLLGQRRSRRR